LGLSLRIGVEVKPELRDLFIGRDLKELVLMIVQLREIQVPHIGSTVDLGIDRSSSRPFIWVEVVEIEEVSLLLNGAVLVVIQKLIGHSNDLLHLHIAHLGLYHLLFILCS